METFTKAGFMKQRLWERINKELIWLLESVLICICLGGIIYAIWGNAQITKLEEKLKINEFVYEESVLMRESIKAYIDSLPVPEADSTFAEKAMIKETEIPVEFVGNSMTECIDRVFPKEERIIKMAMEQQGIKMTVTTLNVSAYCTCVICCGKDDGITASHKRAQGWYTVAAGPEYEFGTKIYIPSLSHTPSGGWFVVEDRGGDIDNGHLDICIMNHQKAHMFGRHNFECYIFEE